MENTEMQRTVAVVTIFYKERLLTSVVLDTAESGDLFVEVMRQALERKGQQHITFGKEVKTVYSIDTIFDDLFVLSDGCAQPQGTLAELIRQIDRLERNDCGKRETENEAG